MPKYIVNVEFCTRRQKEITVYAKDEGEAMEKACGIVYEWDGVTEADAIDVEEAS